MIKHRLRSRQNRQGMRYPYVLGRRFPFQDNWSWAKSGQPPFGLAAWHPKGLGGRFQLQAGLSLAKSCDPRWKLAIRR